MMDSPNSQVLSEIIDNCLEFIEEEPHNQQVNGGISHGVGGGLQQYAGLNPPQNPSSAKVMGSAHFPFNEQSNNFNTLQADGNPFAQNGTSQCVQIHQQQHDAERMPFMIPSAATAATSSQYSSTFTHMQNEVMSNGIGSENGVHSDHLWQRGICHGVGVGGQQAQALNLPPATGALISRTSNGQFDTSQLVGGGGGGTGQGQQLHAALNPLYFPQSAVEAPIDPAQYYLSDQTNLNMLSYASSSAFDGKCSGSQFVERGEQQHYFGYPPLSSSSAVEPHQMTNFKMTHQSKCSRSQQYSRGEQQHSDMLSLTSITKAAETSMSSSAGQFSVNGHINDSNMNFSTSAGAIMSETNAAVFNGSLVAKKAKKRVVYPDEATFARWRDSDKSKNTILNTIGSLIKEDSREVWQHLRNGGKPRNHIWLRMKTQTNKYKRKTHELQFENTRYEPIPILFFLFRGEYAKGLKDLHLFKECDSENMNGFMCVNPFHAECNNKSIANVDEIVEDGEESEQQRQSVMQLAKRSNSLKACKAVKNLLQPLPEISGQQQNGNNLAIGEVPVLADSNTIQALMKGFQRMLPPSKEKELPMPKSSAPLLPLESELMVKLDEWQTSAVFCPTHGTTGLEAIMISLKDVIMDMVEYNIRKKGAEMTNGIKSMIQQCGANPNDLVNGIQEILKKLNPNINLDPLKTNISPYCEIIQVDWRCTNCFKNNGNNSKICQEFYSTFAFLKDNGGCTKHLKGRYITISDRTNKSFTPIRNKSYNNLLEIFGKISNETFDYMTYNDHHWCPKFYNLLAKEMSFGSAVQKKQPEMAGFDLD